MNIVWSYGYGIPGTKEGYLSAPGTAEELDGDKVLICEEYNHDVIVVDKRSKKIIWQFGERGVLGGDDKHLYTPSSAHRLPDGNILIGDLHNNRVLIINYLNKKIEWVKTNLLGAWDAIYWDDDHIMVGCLGMNQVVKVRLSDGEIVWSHKITNPAFLTKLVTKGMVNYYGGDLLIGTEAAVVREVNTETNETIWELGVENERHPYGEFYNRCHNPRCAIRLGSVENFPPSPYKFPVTIVADTWRLFAVDFHKAILWEIGGIRNSSDIRHPSMNFPLPLVHYLSWTKEGNLLITDYSLCRVMEVTLEELPERKLKESMLFSNQPSNDDWIDSQIFDAAGYLSKVVQIHNKHDSNSIEWNIMVTNQMNPENKEGWVLLKSGTLGGKSADYFSFPHPWRFIKTSVKSATMGASAFVDMYISCLKS